MQTRTCRHADVQTRTNATFDVRGGILSGLSGLGGSRVKRLITVSLFVFLAACACAIFAQDVKTPQEPEYVNAFSFVDKDGALKPLERQAARVNTKVKALGFGGGQASYVVSNEHSPVRFSSDASLQFVVRPEGPALPGGGGANNVDPATIVQLYPLKSTKGQRELQIAKAGAFRGAKNTQGDATIPLEIVKYGEHSVLVKPLNPLPPGEYMWAANATFMVPQGYCFGVDPAKR
jgi:hypothetical protein